MIVFDYVFYKNFMSTGNEGITIPLNESDKTLLLGKNGHGKSTMYLALYWCLFGKTFDISLNNNQVINSINNKKTEVIVGFHIGTNYYKIVRGLKPAKFEIYINDEMKPQAASVKDYQKYLGTNILKMSSKTFQQIVILGSKQYTPFMRLKAKERRSVVEDLLDIQYFSLMSDIVKKRASSIKDAYTELVADINKLDNTIELNQLRVDELNNHNKNAITENYEEINKLAIPLSSELNIIEDNKTKLLTFDVDKLNVKLESVIKKNSEISTFKTQISTNKYNTDKKIKFFHDNPECPTCEQSIEDKYKDDILELYNNKIIKYDKGIDKADKIIISTNTDIDFIRSELNNITSYQNNINAANNRISVIESSILTLENQNKKLSESVDTTQDEINIKQMRYELKELIIKRDNITKDLRYFTTIVELLKDGGIKTKIVEQYVPVINGLIKKYLGILDFNVEFILDNEFKETIKSRGRDVFSYGNFSDGQKIRIDLALLFTFREVSRMKNSASTNLLIMDEVADGSMDSDGIDDLIKIINSAAKDKSNIFVISHNDKIIEQFDNSIHFTLKNNFTEINTSYE